jgi:hypothetical protein
MWTAFICFSCRRISIRTRLRHITTPASSRELSGRAGIRYAGRPSEDRPTLDLPSRSCYAGAGCGRSDGRACNGPMSQGIGGSPQGTPVESLKSEQTPMEFEGAGIKPGPQLSEPEPAAEHVKRVFVGAAHRDYGDFRHVAVSIEDHFHQNMVRFPTVPPPI